MKIETRLSGAGEASAPFAGLVRVVRDAGLALAAAALVATPAAAQKITEVVADHVGSPDTYEYIEVAANPAAVHPTGNSGHRPRGPVGLHPRRARRHDGPGEDPSRLPGRDDERLGVLVDGVHDVDAREADVHDPSRLGLHGRGRGRPRRGRRRRPRRDAVDRDRRRRRVLRRQRRTARTYAAPVLGPGFDGVGTEPGGASRFPYYTDTDSVTDWKRNDFDGDGLPGFTGTLAAGEARNTPGAVTRVALADYYAGIDTSSGATLRSTLHARIANHIRYPYTSSTTDTWDMLEAADQDPVNSGQVLDIYKNEIYPKITVRGTPTTTASTPGRTPTVSTTRRPRRSTPTATTSSSPTSPGTATGATSRSARATPAARRTRPLRTTVSAAEAGPTRGTRTGSTARSTRSGTT